MLQTPNYCFLLRIFDTYKNILTASNFNLQSEIHNTTYVSDTTLSFDKIDINATLDELYTTLALVPSDEQKRQILNNDKLQVEISCLEINNEKLNKIILKRGKIGDIAIEGSKISLEIKSILNLLDNKINRRYTFGCQSK